MARIFEEKTDLIQYSFSNSTQIKSMSIPIYYDS